MCSCRTRPQLSTDPERCDLPMFGIYHPKWDSIRMMFDSSAKHQGIALNDVLLQGPDTSNSLQVILKRTQKALMKGGGGHLTLYKIASNSKMVLQMCDSTDLAKDLKDLNIIACSLLSIHRDVKSIFPLMHPKTPKLLRNRQLKLCAAVISNDSRCVHVYVHVYVPDRVERN